MSVARGWVFVAAVGLTAPVAVLGSCKAGGDGAGDGAAAMSPQVGEYCGKLEECGELYGYDVLTCRGLPAEAVLGIWEEPECFLQCLRNSDCTRLQELQRDHYTSCGCARTGAAQLCNWVAECGGLQDTTLDQCVAHPGSVLDLPDVQIPCLGECFAQHSCETAAEACDNEEEGTPCYGYPDVTIRWPAEAEAEQCALVEQAVCGCYGEGTRECNAVVGLRVAEDCYAGFRMAAAAHAFDGEGLGCLAEAACAENARLKSHPEWSKQEFDVGDCWPQPPGLVGTTVGTAPTSLACPAELEGQLSVPGSATDPCDQTNPWCIDNGGEGVNCCRGGHWLEVCQCRLPGAEIECQPAAPIDTSGGGVGAAGIGVGGMGAGTGAAGMGSAGMMIATSPLACPTELEGQLSVPGSTTDPCDQTSECNLVGGQAVNCCVSGEWFSACTCRLPGVTFVCGPSGPVDTNSGGTGGGGIGGAGGTGSAASADPCGNGNIDMNEQCDGTNLSGASCAALGFAGGTLLCESCSFDTSMCIGG